MGKRVVTREELQAKLAGLGHKARDVLRHNVMSDAEIDAAISKAKRKKKPI